MSDFLSNNSKGAVSILLVMLILSAVLVIALGSSLIIATQTKISLSSSESAVAYYAAETGAEYALYEIKQDPDAFPDASISLCSNDAWTNSGNGRYCLNVSGDFDSGTLTVKSIGEYKSTRRSVEVIF